jgi:hypothetical protein
VLTKSAGFRVAESRRWCELKSATQIDAKDRLWRKADLLSIAEVAQGPEAAIEPDLRLALAKARFRWLRST